VIVHQDLWDEHVKQNALIIYMVQIVYIIAFVCMIVNAIKKLENVFVHQVLLDLLVNFNVPLDNLA
jgi:hypothetical protein